jgi:non-ribosomal peptide synthase protein (TIGR01720 family)
LAEGVEDSGPPGSASFRRWAAQAAQAARDGRFDEAREYWLGAGRKQVIGLPSDRDVGPNQVGTAATLTCRLSVEQTGALLRKAPKAYHTQIDDVLLTALMASWQAWSGASRLLLDLEGHGREEVLGEEEVSLSRTVGWFTSLYPVALELPETEDWGEKLKSIKEQLRGVPHRGMSYGWLRYVRGDEELSRQLAGAPQAEVVFNYLGQFDAAAEDEDWCELAWEDVGDEQSRIEERPHLLEISGQVVGGQLSLSWTWSEGRHKRETVEQLAANYLQALQDLITHCCTRKFPSFAHTDFTAASVSQAELDKILDKYRSV